MSPFYFRSPNIFLYIFDLTIYKVNPEVPTYDDDSTPVYQTESGLSQEVERSIKIVLNLLNKRMVDAITGKPLPPSKANTELSADKFYPMFEEKSNHRIV